MRGMDRVERERFIRQAGAWRSLLAPYYVDLAAQAADTSQNPHGPLTAADAIAAAEAVLAGRTRPDRPPKEAGWAVLERRLAEAQQAMRGPAAGV